MLYEIFKWLFLLTVQGYFRAIHLHGKSNIPKSGSVIFTANHNSAFMDPILLAVLIGRPVYFLARGESFKPYLVSKLFKSLNMIPVFRPEVAPDKVHKNKLVFHQCYKHLKKGKALMIFPEGFSETVRKLRPLKTGTARIALGAENQYDFNLDVKIIPIGINYSNPHHFRSDVTINFGDPIRVSSYQEAYLENEKETVSLLTDELKVQMEKLLVVINNEKLDRLVGRIEKLIKSDYLEEGNGQGHSLNDFYVSQDIAAVVEHYDTMSPEKRTAFELKIESYLGRLEDLNIKDSHIKNSKIRLQLFKRLLYFVLGMPLCAYGYIVNIVPYTFAMYLSKAIRVRRDFIGSMKIAFGMFVFLLFYILEILLVGFYSNWFGAIVFAFSLYPAGIFTLNYLKNYYSFMRDYRYSNLFKRKEKMLKNLKRSRNELMEELQSMRKAYQQDISKGAQ